MRKFKEARETLDMTGLARVPEQAHDRPDRGDSQTSSQECWAAKEFGSASFHDARLTRRLISLASSLAERPAQSIPQAVGKWRDVKATYRFFDNPKVSAEEVCAVHRQATVERAQDQDVILAVQDTTTFNFTLHRSTKGLGRIGKAGLSGFFLHSCLAVTTGGVPLGIVGHKFLIRPEETGRDQRKKRDLEQKESYRWIEMTRDVAQVCPASTRVIMVGDRESDIFDLFLLAAEAGHDILVRSAWNRRLDGSDAYLQGAVAASPCLGATMITVPRTGIRPERKAELSLRAAHVALRPPRHRYREHLSAPSVYALWITEETPPDGQDPISWLLLTTLPVQTRADAVRCLTWYTYRWRIERYHYILKSGCRIEELQLETADRLQKAVAVYSVVAWRLLWLT